MEKKGAAGYTPITLPGPTPEQNAAYNGPAADCKNNDYRSGAERRTLESRG